MLSETRMRRPMRTPSPTMRELAIVLFRQRRGFTYVFGLVSLIGVIYALAGTKYEAHMRVLVRRGRADPPVTAQERAPVEFARMEIMEEELNSEVELLKDDEVLRRVVEANDLAVNDGCRCF